MEDLRVLGRMLLLRSLFEVNLASDLVELCQLVSAFRSSLNHDFQFIHSWSLILAIVCWSRIALVPHDPII